MNLSLTIRAGRLERLGRKIFTVRPEVLVAVFSVVVSVLATVYSYRHGIVVSYGDAESHLNIAKRVVHSLTPGFAQLGGIWLPLPHLLLIPLVASDFLWRTGLAGSIVSGLCFVISAVYLYKTAFLITQSRGASLVAATVFMLNPNVLYMQSTPMTELTLIVFFTLSGFYFIKYLQDQKNLVALLFAGIFGFCATLSRYDGWALVLMEAGILFLLNIPWKKIPNSFKSLKEQWDSGRFQKMEGILVMFSTLAFFGIFLWLAWDFVILGDPLYFTHSQFSAKSQQSDWLARGELPAYHNVFKSIAYYLATSMSNAGVVVFILSVIGFFYLLLYNRDVKRKYTVLLLLVPFLFNIATLFLGQSVIFIPSITPSTFEWKLFNVRYGVMMIPFVAVCVSYLFYKSRAFTKAVILALIVLQIGLFKIGYSRVISLDDGVVGLSSATAKIPDAQYWIAQNYDHGLVLVDDYARTLSIIRTKIPMQNIIYVGNKPYWEESFVKPEKYATWIVMQEHDEVWNKLYEDPVMQGRLYKYFAKAYTSPEVLIFKRNDVPVSD